MREDTRGRIRTRKTKRTTTHANKKTTGSRTSYSEREALALRLLAGWLSVGYRLVLQGFRSDRAISEMSNVRRF